VTTLDRGPYILVNTVVTGGMLALISVGLAMVFGVLNIPQFAHGEYFMIGGLAAYAVFKPLEGLVKAGTGSPFALIAPLIAILAALAAGALAGAVTEVLAIRPLRKRARQNWVMNSFLLTVGISVVLINGHQMILGVEFKGIDRFYSGMPLDFFGAFVSRDRVFAVILSFVLIVAFWLFMGRTKTGRAIRAVSQDETGALMVGIPLDSITMLTMSIGCALAAVAGASLLFLYPTYPTVGMEPLYMAWFVVILVGLGNVIGALVGGFMVGLAKVLTIEYIGTGWEYVVPTCLIILVLLIKPSGIFGTEVRGVLDQ
jgi:branched-chain amino acid transport system permease protein